ncbi:MAG: FecR domain-containing protein [Burkholderiales bacterium]|nr:FecR domain-containing protein [Burkholderiales bacterium]OJX04978.1 MAG: hypothetical protein BGO72_06875 [Burkholderiales bacterium 70-64]
MPTGPAPRPRPAPAPSTAPWRAWLLALLLAAPAATAWERLPEAGRVLSAQGETTLVREGSLSSPVAQGVTVRSGDVLRTAERARLSLRMADDGLLAIEPRSEFQVSSYRFDDEAQQSFFHLVRGAVRVVSGAIGKRDPADFRLSTPTATIGIRGTEFIARESGCDDRPCPSGEPAGLTVSVLQGRVVVTSAAGVVEVPAGRTAFFGKAAASNSPPTGAPDGAAPRTEPRPGKGSRAPATDRTAPTATTATTARGAAAPTSSTGATTATAADAGAAGGDGDWLSIRSSGAPRARSAGKDLQPDR